MRRPPSRATIHPWPQQRESFMTQRTSPREPVMPDLPGGTVTLLFTGIEGSTRLLKQLHERYAEALADHQHLLRGVFVENGGREIDTQGDAFFVVFRRAKEAVTAAVAPRHHRVPEPPGLPALSARPGTDVSWPDKGLPLAMQIVADRRGGRRGSPGARRWGR